MKYLVIATLILSTVKEQLIDSVQNDLLQSDLKQLPDQQAIYVNKLAVIIGQNESIYDELEKQTLVGAEEKETDQEKEEREEKMQNIFLAGLVIFIGLFFVVEALFEKYKPPVGHTTGVIVSLGILISWIIFKIKNSDDAAKERSEDGSIVLEDFSFNQALFFDIVLPLIVFPSGFNMRRKKFFKNIGTIMKLGFVATLLCCTLYSMMMYGALKIGWMTRYHPECDVQDNIPATCNRQTHPDSIYDLDIGFYEILSLCSLLCSSDVIAAISMLDYNESPKLFSIVYGEGVFNDIVSIILFGVVQSQFPVKPYDPTAVVVDEKFTWYRVVGIAYDFVVLAIKSVGIGVIIGFISSTVFKIFRPITHSPISETLIIMAFGFFSYFLGENEDGSSIISMLACGITMAHYTWYNLSPQGKTISSVTFSILGSLAESLVFIYIGICTFTYYGIIDKKGEHGPKGDYTYPWSLKVIIVMTAIVFIGRIAAVWTIHFLFKACSKGKADITFRELIFISWGGMIRGAIAFGLVLKIPDQQKTVGIDKVTGEKIEAPIFKELGIMITTTLALVIITTLVFGTFMPVIRNCLFPPHKEDLDDGPEIMLSEQKEEEEDAKSISVKITGETKSSGGKFEGVGEADKNNFVSGNFGGQNGQPAFPPSTSGTSQVKEEVEEEEEEEYKESHYEQVVHPNDERDIDSDEEDQDPNKKGCAYFFKKLDKEILRPLCIYKYNYDKMHRQDDYIDLIQNEQEAMVEIYKELAQSQDQRGGQELELSERIPKAVVSLAQRQKKRMHQMSQVENYEHEQLRLSYASQFEAPFDPNASRSKGASGYQARPQESNGQNNDRKIASTKYNKNHKSANFISNSERY